jgi:hypothetical protein
VDAARQPSGAQVASVASDRQAGSARTPAPVLPRIADDPPPGCGAAPVHWTVFRSSSLERASFAAGLEALATRGSPFWLRLAGLSARPSGTSVARPRLSADRLRIRRENSPPDCFLILLITEAFGQHRAPARRSPGSPPAPWFAIVLEPVAQQWLTVVAWL